MASSGDITARMFDECPVWEGSYEDGFSPVYKHDPLPDDCELLLKVEFVTPGGSRLPGCVSSPSDYFAAIFLPEVVVAFNALLQPTPQEIEAMRRHVPQGALFPLRYETTYRFAGKPPIAGTFAVPTP